ncbi:hypothetical protein CDL15_Pgr015675 [Punica granatum]|uniref:Uncharacterized protein n=1 Tax=Punica granatum TaxID=22663 RepID=A0A218XP83_PUNGR|nr:hypothetical protein CDL15_Pgr015675 [Punica granatum]
MGFGKSWETRMETIYLGRSCSGDGRRRPPQGWRLLWKRFKGGVVNKIKKVAESSAANCNSRSSAHGSYDPTEYLQNFDHGSGWNRMSFSARFADPSSISRRHHLLMD